MEEGYALRVAAVLATDSQVERRRDLDIERGGGATAPLGFGGYEDRGLRQRGATLASIEALTPAMVTEKLFVPFLRPPRRRLALSTSSTSPMIEAFTTAVRQPRGRRW